MSKQLENWKINKNKQTKKAIREEESKIKEKQTKKIINLINDVHGKNMKDEFWQIIKNNTNTASKMSFHLKDTNNKSDLI